jgi:hypothetical protein
MTIKTHIVKGVHGFLTVSTLLLIWVTAMGQSPDPHLILGKLIEKQSAIRDYEAKVEIDVDVEFIKMPVKTATIYFEQPDKVKFKSDDFLMLPKKNMSQSMVTTLLQEDYNAIYVEEDYIEGEPYHYIKIIPYRSKDIVLSGLWIDTTTHLVRRMENFNKSGGNFLIDFEYDKTVQLPSRMKVTFQVKEFNIPLDFINRNIEIDKEKVKGDELKTGHIYLRFYDYKINKGVSDDIFTEE